MPELVMPEPFALIALLLISSLLIWLLVDSDDDNSGGGLHEPVLIPIPVRPRSADQPDSAQRQHASSAISGGFA